MTVDEKQTLLTELTGKHLTALCARFRYPLEIQELFVFDEETWNKQNRHCYQTLQTHLTTKNLKDKRSPYALGKETALSWLIEDLWAAEFVKGGFAVNLNGSDGGRDFTALNQTRSKPDLLITKNGKDYLVEIAVCWSDFILKNNAQTLRLRKLQNLKAYDGYLLTTDLHSRRFFMHKANDLFYMEKASGCYGKKETSIDLSHAIFKAATDGKPPMMLPVRWRDLPKGFFE